MDIAAYSIKNRLIMWLVIILSLFAGWFAYGNMPRFEDPEFTIRTAQVFTPYPGGTPEEVAREVSAPLEEALQDMAEVDEIRSVSSAGFSEISVDIKFSASPSKEDLQIIWTKLRNKVRDAASDLPPGSGSSMVFDEFGDVFGIYYVLTGDGFSMAELRNYAKRLRQDLLAVDGVGKVNIAADQQEVIYVEITRQNAAALGTTVDAIFQQLSTQNTVVAGGSAEVDGRRLTITPTGDIDSVEAISNLLVSPGDGRTVQLSDIAEVSRGYQDPPEFLAYFDGKPAIVLGVAAVAGSNIVAVEERLSQRLAEIEGERPAGIVLQEFYNQGEIVDASVSNFVINVLIALAIVIGTLFIFMGWKSGLVIGIGLLLTISATLGTMYLADIPMHRISLGALIIALGMLVDNAIVVADGILTGCQRGRRLIDIASVVVKRSIWPLLGGTIVGILAFAPIGLAPGDTAEFTGDLFRVILISLMFSWIFAITLTPFLCSILFKSVEDQCHEGSGGTPMEEKGDGKAMAAFRRVVTAAIHRRFVTLGAAAALFVASLAGFSLVTPGFFPASTTPQLVVDYWLPEGTDIKQTDADIKELETYLAGLDGVEHVHSLVGRGTLRYMLVYQFESSNSAYGQILVKVDDYTRLDDMIPKVQAHLDANFPQAQGKVWRFILGPGGGSKIEATFSGPDPEVLRRLAREAQDIYREDGGAIAIKDNWRQPVPAIEPVYSEVKGRRAGVSRSDVGAALARNYSGQQVGVYRENDDLIPIMSRAPENERQDVSDMGTIQVISPTGAAVPIEQVTDGIATIYRDSRLRRTDNLWSIKAQADPAPGVLAGDLQARIQGPVEAIELPPGYALKWDGESGNSEEANGNLMTAIPFGFGAMILVVILLFNALRQPLVIWSVVPLSLVGVVLGLVLMGVPFEFMAILGVLSLAGLLIKNAIVLVDQIDLEISEGKPRFTALVDSAASRVRPVLLGSGTTVLGVLPLFFDAFFKSMAVVLVFGLSFATALTLVIVPVVYAVVFGISDDETGEEQPT
ncbi:putative metabolite exporter, AcrB/D/F family protein [Erythrobacter sp. NAP1]|uniref:efflux RND transporter permease subunit n=1 Tax=Erythrobacter sp. NAP1 TaxID=237727 RepID=UPI0000686A96|nr:efflux RND transporter permease subunit [Erythrobacter sp. NAP1]EAQ29856.1 putative metabolite exporter, AcrB/D/F family protein [Erythrobacter sp. NAP1]